MSDLNNVAEQLRSGAEKFRWLLEAADALDKIGSLDQAAADAEARATKARDDATAAQAVLAGVQQQIADAEAARDANAAKNQAAAQALVDEATKAAAGVVGDANDKAFAILADAGKQAAGVIEQAKAEVAVIQGVRAENETAAKNAQAALAAANDELAEANRKLTEARAAIARLLG